ncbi:MAG TPA: hypothetical protein VM222_03335 [Planctomycetota bacterium]|nr:hypothetical protein [Planctomycetota bacterium]
MKRLLIKVFAGLLAVALLQIPLGYVLATRENPLREQLDALVPMHPDVLYLGDSVLESVASSDAPPISLASMLKKGLPGMSLGFLSGPGHGPEVHRDETAYVLGKGLRPRAIVVPINLRSFSEFWDQMPQLQYSRERFWLRHGDLLGRGLHGPMSTYQLYSALEGYARSEKEYDRIPVVRGTGTLGTLGEIFKGPAPELHLADSFNATYLYSLASDHRKVLALSGLARICRDSGIPLLAYVTPIDIETCERLLGPGIRPRIEKNIDVVRVAMEREGAQWKDAAFLLKARDFDWHRYPNEHLNENGRRRLAEVLDSWLLSSCGR